MLVANHFVCSRRALKDQGYESDTTLVFRRKELPTLSALSPVEQKQAYLNVQAGGEVPLQGFQKPAPEKPKGMFQASNKNVLLRWYNEFLSHLGIRKRSTFAALFDGHILSHI